MNQAHRDYTRMHELAHYLFNQKAIQYEAWMAQVTKQSSDRQRVARAKQNVSTMTHEAIQAGETGSVEAGGSDNNNDSCGDESSGGDDDDDPEPPTELIHFHKPGEVSEPPQPAQINPSTLLDLAVALEHVAQELRKYAPHNLESLNEKPQNKMQWLNFTWLRKQVVRLLLVFVVFVTFCWAFESKSAEALSAFLSAISALLHVSS